MATRKSNADSHQIPPLAQCRNDMIYKASVLKLVPFLRHEVACVFIKEICKPDQVIGCSATRTLPGRASGATLGCEAPGTR